MKHVKVVLVLTAALGAGWTDASASTETSPCKEGTSTTNGVTHRTFCGPGSATVKVGGKFLFFKGGSCRQTPFGFGVNIGSNTVAPAKPDRKYFGIGLLAKKDGTYSGIGAAVGWQVSGQRHELSGERVTLTNGKTRGTFSGMLDGSKVTGSFTC